MKLKNLITTALIVVFATASASAYPTNTRLPYVGAGASSASVSPLTVAALRSGYEITIQPNNDGTTTQRLDDGGVVMTAIVAANDSSVINTIQASVLGLEVQCTPSRAAATSLSQARSQIDAVIVGINDKIARVGPSDNKDGLALTMPNRCVAQ